MIESEDIYEAGVMGECNNETALEMYPSAAYFRLISLLYR